METTLRRTNQSEIMRMWRYLQKEPWGGILRVWEEERMETVYAPHGFTLLSRGRGEKKRVFSYLDRVPDQWLERDHVEVYRVQRGVSEYTPEGQEEGAWQQRWEERVFHLRFALALMVLEQCKQHLEKRRAQGIPTLQHQMVKSLISDFLILLECVYSRDSTSSDLEQRRLRHFDHTRLDQQVCSLLKLMGGHGYISSGCSRWGHALSVIHNVWVVR
ncbi:hypothetical protein [Mechercharimyces sp. CAU 1602]|uniref:hypothetical protein n=1 Tax=Mechercharimyces sp. CAU 1602 TaxID=2973933 RepID=UPI0021634470|nr:hypothetical protein [Mechercharimyces sp. CAU 1602]MCS1352495.1 hypothetical protein [Mechercharimyces sp. CAU 1602]